MEDLLVINGTQNEQQTMEENQHIEDFNSTRSNKAFGKKSLFVNRRIDHKSTQIIRLDLARRLHAAGLRLLPAH